jgi:hypothetical protein
LFESTNNAIHKSASRPPDAVIFAGCFFYAEGVEDYRAFSGPLPIGITWSDTPSTLVAKLGPPDNEIKNKKTGALSAQRWFVRSVRITASFNAKATLDHVYAGIY